MPVIEITNDESFENEVLNSEKKVLIDFNATWCGPCRMLKPIIEEVASKQDNVKIVAVDVDDNEDIAKKYGVMSIPCLVLIENGEEIKRNVGFIPEEEVFKMIGEE